MREKVTASFLFKSRKESYARSVAHPFQGDYVRLRQNSQWRKLVNDTSDHYIVFADIVSKITRSSGRVTISLIFKNLIEIRSNKSFVTTKFCTVGSGSVCGVDQFHDDPRPTDVEHQIPGTGIRYRPHFAQPFSRRHSRLSRQIVAGKLNCFNKETSI